MTVKDTGSRRTVDKEPPCGSEENKKIQHKVFVSKVHVASPFFFSFLQMTGVVGLILGHPAK